MRISQAAERTGSGRARRKIRETEILRAEGGGGALPIEHRQSPMVPRLSAKHGVGAVLRYLTPSCGGFGFTAYGCGTLHGCTRQLRLCVFLLFESKIFEDPPPSPANWDECETDAADVASLSASRGPESCFDSKSSTYIKKPGNTKSGRLCDTKNKKTVKLEEEMQKLVGCECAIDLCSAAVFPELGAEGGFLACE